MGNTKKQLRDDYRKNLNYLKLAERSEHIKLRKIEVLAQEPPKMYCVKKIRADGAQWVHRNDAIVPLYRKVGETWRMVSNVESEHLCAANQCANAGGQCWVIGSKFGREYIDTLEEKSKLNESLSMNKNKRGDISFTAFQADDPQMRQYALGLIERLHEQTFG